VEDSAAAAVETTREPVAVEAVIAWEAADTVAAVVAAAAVTEAAAEDVEAAAEDGDKRSMRKNKMNPEQIYDFVEILRDCLRDS